MLLTPLSPKLETCLCTQYSLVGASNNRLGFLKYPLSQSLAEFVVNAPQADGYFFKQSYMSKNNQKCIQIEKKQFHLYQHSGQFLRANGIMRG